MPTMAPLRLKALACLAISCTLSVLQLATPATASNAGADTDTNSFDFVIIGGGTAGLAVASRLSEIPDITIAVVEAGKDEGDNPNVTSVAEYGGTAGQGTQIDWAYETVEQRYAGGRKIGFHAGRAWGGTSTINGMTYIRAEKAQIDAWETLGNKGWSWGSLWPYHLKSERYETPTKAQMAAGASYVDAYHGRDGPLNVAYQYGLQNGSFASLAKQTWETFGMPFNPDVNGGNVRGFSVWPQTLDREANVREHSARAYYYPVRDRSNLVIFRGRVDRISWAGTNGSKALAEGVEYTTEDGRVKTLYAEKEVIVSAGAVRTPAILELSGVGNPELLEQLDIPVKVSLPSVGENAIDQPNSFISYSSTKNFTGIAPYVTYMTALDVFGPETQRVADEISSQIKSWAEQVSAASPGHGLAASAIEHQYRVQHDLIFNQDVAITEILTTSLGPLVGTAFWISLPFSRGSVHIHSSDPSVHPSLDPNYLMAEWDLVFQRRIAQLIIRYWGTDPVRSLAGQRIQPTVGDLPVNATDEEWNKWIEGSLSPNQHLVGTASMLPKELGGVVDANLLVYGTENVRVVDASVLPGQISGHLTSLIYAVSERAADIIKETLGG